MLGLALVKAPLVVGRRCVGRLRRQRRTLWRKKRIRDVAVTAAVACDDVREKATVRAEADIVVDTVSSGEAVGADDEDDLAWLEEMHRTEHWDFGRLSFSGKIP
ncbi:hypothetical protein ABZP36_013571 [Zizania latifolia]